jgi:hypothetical protein
LNDNLTSAESANLPNANDRDHWMFGAGYEIILWRAWDLPYRQLFRRRICPGMIVAEREIWLVISRMLWAFNMEEIPGEPIDLKEYDGLSGRSPVPFRIQLRVRHEKVKTALGL